MRVYKNIVSMWSWYCEACDWYGPQAFSWHDAMLLANKHAAQHSRCEHCNSVL